MRFVIQLLCCVLPDTQNTTVSYKGSVVMNGAAVVVV